MLCEGRQVKQQPLLLLKLRAYWKPFPLHFYAKYLQKEHLFVTKDMCEVSLYSTDMKNISKTLILREICCGSSVKTFISTLFALEV